MHISDSNQLTLVFYYRCNHLELKNLILDTLNEKTINETGFLNYNYLFKEVIKPHLDNESNNHKKIWNIFVLVNWLKINKLV